MKRRRDDAWRRRAKPGRRDFLKTVGYAVASGVAGAVTQAVLGPYLEHSVAWRSTRVPKSYVIQTDSGSYGIVGQAVSFDVALPIEARGGSPIEASTES
jgi:hypothetical protein